MQATSVCLALLTIPLAASATRADAVADLRSGTTLALVRTQVSLDHSPRASTMTFLRKTAGGLDVELAARDLGVDLPITLHLHGVALRGGRIDYTIDERFSPALDVGGGQSLERVSGRLAALTLPLPGIVSPIVGNVAVRLEAAGALIATGTWGELSIAIDQLDLQGGVIQPPLSAFAAPAGIICSSREPTEQVFTVTLFEPAQGTGANVSFATPSRRGVRLPLGTVVNAGRRTASVTGRIEPNFVGTVRVNAAAAGALRSLDVEVHPARDCERR